MNVTAVIPCYNAASTIEATLGALIDGRRAPDDIICVDDGSTDHTAATIRRWTYDHGVPVRLLSMPDNRGAASARNRGGAAAAGELILFLDADVVVREDTVERLCERLSAGSAAAVVALYEPRSLAGGRLANFQSLLANATFRTLDRDALPYLGTQCVLLPRDVFQRAGGFLERYGGATVEDFELGFRIMGQGQAIALAPGALIAHNRRYSFGSFTRNYVDKGRALAGLLARWGPRHTAFGVGYSSWRNVLSLPLVVAAGVAGCLTLPPGAREVAVPMLGAALLGLVGLWWGLLRTAWRYDGSVGVVVAFLLRCYVTILGAVGGMLALRVTPRTLRGHQPLRGHEN